MAEDIRLDRRERWVLGSTVFLNELAGGACRCAVVFPFPLPGCAGRGESRSERGKKITIGRANVGNNVPNPNVAQAL